MIHLKEGERIVKTYHHHPFPFAMQLVKTVAASAPFFFLLYLIKSALSTQYLIIAILSIVILFSLVIVYLALIYWLDRLVITNKRIVHIDWKFLTKRDSQQALLHDIQDIRTHEQGILASLYIFDHGTIRIETASSKTTIVFIEAPDPEGMKAFISDQIRASKNERAYEETKTETQPISA